MPPDLTPPKTVSRFLHAFLTYPKATFNTQGPNEQILLILRAHPITQITWVFNTFVLILILILLNIFFPSFLNANQIIFVNLFGISIIFAYAWFNFLHWYFNVGIVTNERVIDVDFTNITYKEVSEARLSKIEDVTAKSAGYFGTIFNYGNVFVQTAGTDINVEFINVPDPAAVVKIINDLLPA